MLGALLKIISLNGNEHKATGLIMHRLKQILQNETTGGILLIVAAILAMLMANSQSAYELYLAFLAIPVEVHIGALRIDKDMLHWINDALMASFFLYVGLEVKKELVQGSLSSLRQAVFPVFAAIGGIIVPALIYLALNQNHPITHEGWAIPVATDIAFALGVLALLGKRVPAALTVFLMALAIIDDLGAIIIIALFFTSELSFVSLCVGAGAISTLVLMNRAGVRRLDLYLVVGVILWTAVLKSGVHATLAGAIIGLCIPLQEKDGHSPATTLEHTLKPWVTYLILPLFAFGNAGVALHEITIDGLIEHATLPLGIIFGLLLGKPIGISLFCLVAVKLNWARLPQGVNFKQIMATGVLCGIGFTMSIFITTLAFSEDELIDMAKLGILLGSLLSAVIGYFLLRRQTQPQE